MTNEEESKTVLEEPSRDQGNKSVDGRADRNVTMQQDEDEEEGNRKVEEEMLEEEQAPEE